MSGPRRLLRPPTRRRRKVASTEKRQEVRDLANRAQVEVPRVAFKRETDDAIRALREHLDHMRQPTLGPMD